MKLFLSALEAATPHVIMDELERRGVKMKYNLVSYYYVRKKDDVFERIRDSSELVIVDSGAHSFQKGVKVDWVQYTHEYAAWIRRMDRPNVVGYFEMDVDNVLGIEKVEALRKILETESGVQEKIIPVWHKNRGIEYFRRMCEEKKGSTAAITGWKNEDIKDEQYLMFLKHAWKCGTRLHCLGMARRGVLSKVPFDYADASSWKQQCLYGRGADGRKLLRPKDSYQQAIQLADAYEEAIEYQNKLELKWRNVKGFAKSPSTKTKEK